MSFLFLVCEEGKVFESLISKRCGDGHGLHYVMKFECTMWGQNLNRETPVSKKLEVYDIIFIQSIREF